ncbi:MAG: hypothetical protein L0Y39_05135 [Methylococcaceae bacterium]|nr:hypothetical protein [Methylococcaceae bacterium]
MPPEPECATIDLAGAAAVMVGPEGDLAQALVLLGLTSGPVLVLVGGAGSLHPDAAEPVLRKLFFEVLAPLAESLQAIVIDGGTDSGVMKLMGAARSEIRGTFPLLGVASVGTIDLPEHSGNGPQAAALESRHSHFLIVPGDRFGDESSWIARAASLLSEGRRSLTVAVNGGSITLRDISFSILENRPVLVVSGSGRTADRVAGALAGGDPDPEIRALVRSGLIQAVEIDREPADLTRTLRGWLIR